MVGSHGFPRISVVVMFLEGRIHLLMNQGTAVLVANSIFCFKPLVYGGAMMCVVIFSHDVPRMHVRH